MIVPRLPAATYSRFPVDRELGDNMTDIYGEKGIGT